MDSYLDALEKELDYVAVKFGKKHLNSIYIGGGTPTTLEPYQLDRLIRVRSDAALICHTVWSLQWKPDVRTASQEKN